MGRIGRVDERLRHDRRHLAADAGAGKRVLQRLREHVADPSRRARDEDAQGQRLDGGLGELVPGELVTDLRTVPVHDGDLPPSRASSTIGAMLSRAWRN
jgi:hypothetical protein